MTKKMCIKKFFSGILIAVLLANSLGVQAFASTSIEQDKISLTELEDTAGSYIQSKVDIMLANEAPIKRKNLNNSNAISVSPNEAKLITEYREYLSRVGETYNASETSFEILSQNVTDDGKLHVVAKETTMLTIAENGVETGYSANHEFIYTQINGIWKLTEDRQLEPTGLLPLYQANLFVYSEQEEANKNIQTVPEQGLAMATNNDEIEASTIKPSEPFPDKMSYRASRYNYKAMADYLEKYWENYNPAYRDFSGKGGDCTNFVSQALYAGGWAHKSGWYRNANYWWYNSFNQTWSWVNVDFLGTFARNSGRCIMLDNVWKLGVGDFLQVKPANSDTKVHSMMVSYVSNGTPYFTYHTSNRYRRSMNQVLADWGNASYYAYRT